MAFKSSTEKKAEDLSARAEKGAEEARDAASEAVDRAADRAEDTLKRGCSAVSNAMANSGDLTGKMRSCIYKEPVLSVAVALAAGWLLGRFMRP